jgi:DNA-binding MarR family transcriptional regulator
MNDDSAITDTAQRGAKTDPLDRMLCYAIYSAGLAMNRAYKPRLDSLGITYLQYLALLLLRQRNEQSIKELGERLSLDSNTLTPLVKRLEAGGFVKRRRDSADERVVRVNITAAGEKVVAEALCVSSELTAKVTPEQRKALIGLLFEIGQQVGALPAS